jgi:hypothetical protein
VTDRSRKEFQPMNANYGLFPPLETKERGRDKKRALGSACAFRLVGMDERDRAYESLTGVRVGRNLTSNSRRAGRIC